MLCVSSRLSSPRHARSRVVEALYRAGVPPAALALLPGDGDAGAALVAHPGIQTVAFTGSMEVGSQIIATAAQPAPGQRHLKRVVAEMGGKNCMIVDADADLDDVVPALLSSAFGFAGQKCSATSCALVHERVVTALLGRLRGALDLLSVGPAEQFGIDVPPVIEAAARTRIQQVINAIDERGARIHRTEHLPTGDGHFVAPTLGVEADAESPAVRDEIFGPVLSVEAVGSVEHACDLVGRQPHALAGALFSRNPATIAMVAGRTPVGNLYINRGTTGAMVGRQPFGGNRMSGTGTKAGGPDYLLHFVEPVVVTEDTVRHGIAA